MSATKRRLSALVDDHLDLDPEADFSLIDHDVILDQSFDLMTLDTHNQRRDHGEARARCGEVAP